MRTILLSNSLLMTVLNLGCGGAVLNTPGEKSTAISQSKESGGEDPLAEASSTVAKTQHKEFAFSFEAPLEMAYGGPPRCWEQRLVPFTLTSEAEVPHLGHTVMNASVCFSLDTLGLAYGEAVFTAANGDSIIATFGGFQLYISDQEVVRWDVSMWVNGGTGRFQNATGTLFSFIDWYSGDDPNGPPSTQTIHGAISY